MINLIIGERLVLSVNRGEETKREDVQEVVDVVGIMHSGTGMCSKIE